MTYREKIEIENPYAINPLTFGGVNGCPGDHFDGAPRHHDGVFCNMTCRMCWDSKMPDDIAKEPTSFQEDMMAVLGDMTKAQAKFAIEWLWNKYFKEED